jgi:carbon storage regulator CsrA
VSGNLILKRNVGEAFVIGTSVRVTVLRITSEGAVDLAIEAPPGVRVLRTELLQRQPKREAKR